MTDESTLIEELKAEAVSRMKVLHLMPNVINEFKKDDKLNYSMNGILYWLEDEWLDMVRNIEKRHGFLVYHAVYNSTEYGDLLTLLVVTKEKERWDEERNDIFDTGISYAYTINLSYNDLSECGYVMVKPRFGGIVRVE